MSEYDALVLNPSKLSNIINKNKIILNVCSYKLNEILCVWSDLSEIIKIFY
jgi:hypothetical protein